MPMERFITFTKMFRKFLYTVIDRPETVVRVQSHNAHLSEIINRRNYHTHLNGIINKSSYHTFRISLKCKASKNT